MAPNGFGQPNLCPTNRVTANTLSGSNKLREHPHVVLGFHPEKLRSSSSQPAPARFRQTGNHRLVPCVYDPGPDIFPRTHAVEVIPLEVAQRRNFADTGRIGYPVEKYSSVRIGFQ